MLALASLALSISFAKITVHADQPTVRVSPSLFGIFFEEINCAGDGGIYAELVRNRSFEDDAKPVHWTLAAGSSGNIQVARHPGNSFNTQYLEVVSNSKCAVANEGYWGMNLSTGQRYRLQARIRSARACEVRLEDPKGKVLAKATLAAAPDWSDQSIFLTPSGSTPNGRLVIGLNDSGKLDVDFVSLFPEAALAKSGLRPDLTGMLKALKPAFMRFPGGCWVEGDTMDKAQRWKTTIGPLAERRTQPNIWGYQSTNGLGFHEYLSLCEEIGADPLFVVNCGMSHREVVPMDKMDEFVQDALDAIEYANGPVTSKWGAVRARNGHPAPFHLKYLEIGNENGGPAYEERYGLIYRAVKAKYPEIVTIANVWGGVPTKTPIDVIDEHYYSSPDFFFQNATRYDSYDRKGPKVYVGEYAVTQGCGNGNLIGALGEAAFMTGMERNSDHVVMASYAPLFANLNLKAWNPDLIYFDSAKVYGTPSYYVQKLFAENRPERVVKTDVQVAEATRPKFLGGGIGVGTWATQAEFKDIRVESGGKTLFGSPTGEGLKVEGGEWKLVDGAFRQTSGFNGARAWIGDSNWKNYTLTLKARKISGDEGFLVTVGRQDGDNYIWLNLGGWGNHQHAIERAVAGGKSLIGRQVNGSIETGRWYDIRVEYTEDRIKAFLDGKKVYDEGLPSPKTFHVVSGLSKAGEVIVKVVNGGATAEDATLDIRGVAKIGSVTAEVLTSKSPVDENSLQEPLKVSPKKASVRFAGNTITHKFPPYSLTIIRCKPAVR
ncbi:MAG: alpha-L-arabinofuranosidase C-terminal domain-containing protein [Fimbriimonadales bacterium]